MMLRRSLLTLAIVGAAIVGVPALASADDFFDSDTSTPRRDQMLSASSLVLPCLEFEAIDVGCTQAGVSVINQCSGPVLLIDWMLRECNQLPGLLVRRCDRLLEVGESTAVLLTEGDELLTVELDGAPFDIDVTATCDVEPTIFDCGCRVSTRKPAPVGLLLSLLGVIAVRMRRRPK